jgi:hypothetical protein
MRHVHGLRGNARHAPLREEGVHSVNHRLVSRLLQVGAMLIAAALLSGCGTGKVAVEGEVTVDGTPVEEGSITFDPGDGKGPSTGATIVDGYYRLEGPAGATPGAKIVRIRAFRKTGRKIASGPPSPPGTLVDEIVQYVPAAYNDRTTLRPEIAGESEVHLDFPLKSKP